jgi:predicted ester cyclase
MLLKGLAMTIPVLVLCTSASAESLVGPESIAPVSEKKTERSHRIDAAFNGLDKDNMHVLDDFYAESVEFQDPVNRLSGLDALRAYYTGMYQNVKDISFDITLEVVEGDTHVICWTMTMSVDKFNGGKPIVCHGSSVLRFGADDKVVYHRDYFDMGEMLYQHVPVLGYMVKKAKEKLEKGSRG